LRRSPETKTGQPLTKRQQSMHTSNQSGKRIALVTGASRGIGRAIALRLAADGHAVIVNGSGQQAAEKIAAELSASGAQALALAADVSDERSVAGMIGEIDRRFGRLDIVVNNAGISPRVEGTKPTVETTPLEHWTRTLSVNLTGTFLVCRAALPLMRRRQWGRIVNIGSISGRMNTGNGSAHYAASKAGMIGFSRVLAGEAGQYGITVNCVAPGRISTDMAATFANAGEIDKNYIARTPLGRIGEPGDVAAAVAFLVSEDAGFITGDVLNVTGGMYMP
jgi:3-oxoacyl-[acyl-carrier protein] reductase